MKKMFSLSLSLFAGLMVLMSACGRETSVVESGTYTGTVDKVEADKSEIYVETDDGKMLELYFIEETVLVQQGDTVAFENLAKGQRVEIELEKVGKRLDPITVKIVE